MLMATLFVTLNACASVNSKPQTLIQVQSVLTCPPELSGEIAKLPPFPDGEQLIATQKVHEWVGDLGAAAFGLRARLIDAQMACAEYKNTGSKK